MALVQTTTKSPVASEAVATAGGATAPATRLVFTTNSGATGVWVSRKRSSSASTLGRLCTIGRGRRFVIRERNSEGNMNFSGRGSGRGPTRLALADAGRVRRRGAELALAGVAAQRNAANDLLRG